MIYCEPCRTKHNWPVTHPHGLGKCEVCSDLSTDTHSIPFGELFTRIQGSTAHTGATGKSDGRSGEFLIAQANLMEATRDVLSCLNVADDDDNSYHSNDGGGCLADLKLARDKYKEVTGWGSDDSNEADYINEYGDKHND